MREDDAKIASILGWRQVKEEWHGTAGIPPEKEYNVGVPHYTTNAGDDYLVLEWVKNIIFDRVSPLMDTYSDALYDVWMKRMNNDTSTLSTAESRGLVDVWISRYEPGDYSRALLKLKERGLI